MKQNKLLDIFSETDEDVSYTAYCAYIKSLLNGAICFAQEGFDKIWFSLLPYANKDEIDPLEIKLIRIASRWNREHGFRPLLNKKDITSRN